MIKHPKVSVITPSYNQAKFIRMTIDSVLSQNYPNLEYIVMDGGSTDGTVEILKSYGKRIEWVSKKDKGQSDAINKGMKLATGDIIGYLNSDDCLTENALWRIGEIFSQNREIYFLTGKCRIINEQGNEVRKFVTSYKNLFLKYFRNKFYLSIVQFISQPATFWRREIIDKIGFFDESLFYTMDYDYWLRIIQHNKLYFVDDYLAYYRVHKNSKTGINPEKQFEEEYSVICKYTQNPLIRLLHRFHIKIPLIVYRLLKKRN